MGSEETFSDEELEEHSKLLKKEVIREKISHLPERYRNLVQQVLDRLPWGWDREDPENGMPEVEWDIDMNNETISTRNNVIPFGGATSLDEEGYEYSQFWVITLYHKNLESLSDRAVIWVIAHEFGHAASRLPCGSILIDGEKYTPIMKFDSEADRYIQIYERVASEDLSEQAADDIARSWGFTEEEEIFNRERDNLNLNQ